MKTMDVIKYENLSDFAFSNDQDIQGDIRGIVVEFNHLYWQEMLIGTQNALSIYVRSERGSEYIKRAYNYANEGILFVLPYTNPWSWMATT